MYTRKLIDFLFPDQQQQSEPRLNAGVPAEAEFSWPPSPEDLETFTIVDLSADDHPEVAPLSEIV